jgi:hypothetical protein
MSQHKPVVRTSVYISYEMERLLKEKHFSFEDMEELAVQLEPPVESDSLDQTFLFEFSSSKKARQFVKELEKKL